MNERKLQIRLVVCAIAVAICASLYSWGGMEYKWLRRYLMPAVFFATAFGITRNWRVFIAAPLAVMGICLGYGDDVWWVKAIKRAYCGAIAGFGFSCNLWYAVFAIVISMYLGVCNPFPARVEEFVLGLVYSSSLFLYIKE